MNPKARVRDYLHQLGGIFNLDLIYVTRGGFWAAVRFVAGFLASLVSMITFGNLLSKENYGIYNYLLSLASSLAFLTLTGIGPVLTRAVARGEEQIIRYALRFELRYNLLSTAVIAAGGLYYYAKGNLVFALSLIILAVVIPMEAAFHIFESVFTGRKQFDTLTIISILSAFASTLATVGALLFTKSVVILVLMYSLTSLGPSSLAYYFASRKVPRTKPSAEEIGELRRSAFHITGAGLLGAAAQYIDKITLFHFAGAAALATYGFAIAGPERLKGVVKEWVNITLPRLAEREIHEIRHVFYTRIGLSLLVGAGCAAVYLVAAPILFHLLLPKYLDSIAYSQVYALGLVFIPPLIYMGNIYYSQNMLRAIYITSTTNQVLRITLFIVFGFLWQTWGLVFAFLLAQILGTVFGIIIWEWESRRHLRLS